MQKWLIVLGGILIAIVVYEVLRRQVLKRTALKIRLTGQRTTDAAMLTVLTALSSAKTAQQVSGQLHSTPVAAVWGRGVMAFEYVLDMPGMVPEDLPEIRKLLNNHLQAYATDEGLTAFRDAGPVLRVTDTWLRDQQLHVDVAYLMNEATLEYLEDLRRLNRD
ncbi:hypothetical protein [Lactiplantibacillus mudanjiangensis]|uniref:Uncharacterized protein n=1 Tax=Lactiplantibacillus mudanjiangensis TaxID=1296538 RepID=A0A660EA72_9LACO|nr:hypothetical protein [Lactiplantibacillus mudanjiangensis]VDG20741.1 hypothetical protein MUDAN_BIHEEGNE_02351 [Lactiplantibacillus mudanjiangensis]VDG23867.1 hypothetical protein MUDAN_IGPPGNFN_02387 [Lactiplantibacillus mudanjiangensis]VDG30094.1 hypothetical protein MUDAN_MDHGFNIF_01649 [Lactiplantibacillus mudanjiangensis]VDG30581.1 hypothetical protein MUDAN_DOGOELCO_00081 [Lactiplantibacillus mudanjiangensis]